MFRMFRVAFRGLWQFLKIPERFKILVVFLSMFGMIRVPIRGLWLF